MHGNTHSAACAYLNHVWQMASLKGINPGGLFIPLTGWGNVAPASLLQFPGPGL